jgi:hypothetical protein
METIFNTLEGSRAVDTGEHGATAPALVRVKLRLLDDVVASFAIDCFCARGFSVQWRATRRWQARTGNHFV